MGRKKKRKKKKRVTVLTVNDGLTDKVPTLRDFETLGGCIVKIKISVAELKIVVNFRGMIYTFSL
jgi:hypothetical protein